jgi:hypothetical protein
MLGLSPMLGEIEKGQIGRKGKKLVFSIGNITHFKSISEPT